jgi:hypothetical protein
MLAMEIDTKDFSRQLRAFAETPALIAKTVRGALSETVDDLHTRELMEMEKVFDRPSGYVKKGLKKRYPNKAGVLSAGIEFAYFPVGRSPEDIMKPHVFGGSRPLKRSERKLGGMYTAKSPGYPTDRNGNIIGARYVQMMNELGLLQDIPTKGRKSAENRQKRGWQFFVYRDKSGKAIGIMEKRGKTQKMMLVFTRQPGYRKNVKFDYFEVAQKQIAYSLPLHFNRIMNRYASRL